MNSISKYVSYIVLSATISVLHSCTTYRMVTNLGTDGSFTRDFQAERNSFPFDRTDWSFSELNDSGRYKFMLSRRFNSSADYAAAMNCNDTLRLLLVPEETVKKRFKWFYTVYDFEVRYKSLANHLPIPLGGYMSDAEQRLWFQGDMSAYKGLSGVELKDVLDECDKNFSKWFDAASKNTQFETFAGVLSDNDLNYRLLMPGKLQTSNAPVISGDTLSWKVGATRFAAHDYLLTASSRTVNYWAFVVTVLLAAALVFGIDRWYVKKSVG